MATRKQRQWLDSQLPEWVQAGLIRADQAEALRQHYPPINDGVSLARVAFSAIGAILFGLGVILFFAWNWDALHRSLKFLLVFGSLLAAHAGGLWLRYRAQAHRVAAEGLSLLGSLLFGAGIALVSQVYHIDEHWPNAFLLWGLGALALAWALPSLWQAGLALGLLLIWGGAQALAFDQPLLLAVLLPLSGLLPLAVWQRSRWLLQASLASAFLLLAFYLGEHHKAVLLPLLYSLAVFCLALGLWLQGRAQLHGPGGQRGLFWPAWAVVLLILYGLSFIGVAEHWRPFKALKTAEPSWLLFLILAAALLMAARALWPQHGRVLPEASERGQLGLALLGLLLCHAVALGWLALPDLVLALLVNALFIGHCLLFITHGSQHRRGAELAIGCLLFAALVFARYSDLFESLLSRSLVFLLLGAGLFLVGNLYARKKPAQSESQA